MAFDFKKSLIRVQGGQSYLPVSARIVWFRQERPDWGIHTEPLEINHEKQYAIFRATIYNAEGRLMATGTKKEDVKGFGDFIEKAECVPLDTRILTAEGWKSHDELRLGEAILGYNAETDKLEWGPLLAVRRYENAPVVHAYNGKGFDVVCTPDHKWPVRYGTVWNGKRYDYQLLRETNAFTKADAITVSAIAPSGTLSVTPDQAFIMGMLITDGCVRYSGKHITGYICQSKPAVVTAIRERLAGVPHREDVVPAHTRTFPTGRTYDCLVGHRWHPAASYLHDLHDAFGIVHETELPNVVAGLSGEARAAMLEAMTLAESDKRGNFAQMPGRNDWVIDLWTALCAMEGSMVCKAIVRESCGGIWTARRKKTRNVWASNVKVENAGTADVWCPQTPFGTWVARFSNDVVTITGNTGSVGRALALCGFGTQFAPELDETRSGRFADSPQPMGGGRYGGNPNGGSPNGGSGGTGRYGNAPQGNGGGDGARFSPPREASNAPAEARPAPPRAEASRPEPSRPEPVRQEAPRPAPAPVHDDGEDDFEALIGAGGLKDASEDDPFGDDDGGAPAQAVKVSAPAGTNTNGMPACVNCNKALTKAQQELSIRNYGKALCPGCQKDKSRQPALAER